MSCQWICWCWRRKSQRHRNCVCKQLNTQKPPTAKLNQFGKRMDSCPTMPSVHNNSFMAEHILWVTSFSLRRHQVLFPHCFLCYSARRWLENEYVVALYSTLSHWQCNLIPISTTKCDNWWRMPLAKQLCLARTLSQSFSVKKMLPFEPAPNNKSISMTAAAFAAVLTAVCILTEQVHSSTTYLAYLSYGCYFLFHSLYVLCVNYYFCFSIFIKEIFFLYAHLKEVDKLFIEIVAVVPPETKLYAIGCNWIWIDMNRYE